MKKVCPFLIFKLQLVYSYRYKETWSYIPANQLQLNSYEVHQLAVGNDTNTQLSIFCISSSTTSQFVREH